MLFKDIAKLTAGLLDREDVAEDIESGAGSAQTKRERALIERCVNLAIAQTAAEYAPLRAEAEIYTENGLVEFSALEKNAADLVRVTDRYGNDLAVKYYTDYFKTAPGTIRVEYTYLPTAARRTTKRLWATGGSPPRWWLSARRRNTALSRGFTTRPRPGTKNTSGACGAR